MINSEILSQMSRKLVEMESELNSHILEVLNTAIEEKILPSIENARASNKEGRETKWDLRSGGRHPDKLVQTTQKSDLKSHRQQRSKTDQQAQELEEIFPRLIATSGNQKDHYRENSVNSDEGEDGGYDTKIETSTQATKESLSETKLDDDEVLIALDVKSIYTTVTVEQLLRNNVQKCLGKDV